MNSNEYKHNYSVAGVDVMSTDLSQELIGNLDAKIEWRDKPDAESKFINIESYYDFIDPASTFLVGRTGTGKTAMLNKLHYDVEQGENHYYSASVLVDAGEYIAKLSSILRSKNIQEYSYTEIEHIARQEWEKAMNIIAMKSLYIHYKHNLDKFKKRPYAIEAFLESNGLLSEKITIRRIMNKLCDNLKETDSSTIQTTVAISNVATEIFDAYDRALDEFEDAFPHGKHMLLLIDTVERYEFQDRIVLAVLNAMINACVYCNDENMALAVKMALPSELIPNLLSINMEKIIGKMVYIRWNQADLKAVIAVRVYKYINGIKGNVDQRKALEFFDSYYDEYCTTIHNFRFPTFSYCMSYTQKKPRQMISIFNTWLNLERQSPERERMSLITNAITQNELVRVQGALNIYSSIHPDMFEMFKRTFVNRSYCFSESDFDKWLKACAPIRGTVDSYELKKFFIASGLVGVTVELHMIDKDTFPFENDRIIRIKEVVFEYQYKERLPFNGETKFCLHPMCYRILASRIDLNTLVYPKPLELENEFVPWANKTCPIP